MRQYVVKQYVDTLDTNPTVSDVVPEWEALDIKAQWLYETVDYVVQHSPYTVSETEYGEIVEAESALIIIEEI